MKEEQDRQHKAQQPLDRRIGFLLRVGMIISLILIATGIIISVVKAEPAATPLTPLSQIPAGLVNLSAPAFITAGLVIILLLPVAIILIALAHFISVRERNPLIVCLILLAMLAASFIFIVK